MMSLPRVQPSPFGSLLVDPRSPTTQRLPPPRPSALCLPNVFVSQSDRQQDAASAVPFEVQDITATSVVQDDTGTTVSFTRPIAPGGDKYEISAVPGDTTAFIYGVGADNELAFTASDWSGFRLDVFCGSGADDIVARTPSPMVTDAPTVEEAAETTAPTAGDRAIDVPSPAPLVPGATPSPGASAAPGTTPGVTPEDTAAPTTSEEADGQGDSDGASRAGGASWAAAAAAVATGVAGVLAVLAL